MRSISYIIPSYLSAATISHTVRSIQNQFNVDQAEIIIADSSPYAYLDEIKDELTGPFPVRIVHSEERLFPGEARNLGLEHALMQFVAFIDSDIVLRPNWTTTIVEHYEKQKDLGHKVIIGAGLSNSRLSNNMWSNAMTILGFYHIYPNGKNEPRAFLPSANLFTEKEILKKNGLVFKPYRMAEDFLYCREACSKGIGFYFIGTHSVEHIMIKDFFKYSYYMGAATSVCRLSTGGLVKRLLYSAMLPIGSVYKLGTLSLGILRAGPAYTWHALKYFPLLLLSLPFLHWGMIHYPLRKARWRKC